jgi:hypothetical protein
MYVLPQVLIIVIQFFIHLCAELNSRAPLTVMMMMMMMIIICFASVKSGYGGHPASCPMGTSNSFLGDKDVAA